jgi:O-antigen ligase
VLSSHSSFVDTLVDLGVLGLALLTVVVVSGVVVIVKRATRSPDPYHAWWLGVLAFALVENLVESMMLMHSIFWILLIAPGFATARSSTRPANA